MNRLTKGVALGAAALAALVGLGWIGLQIEPAPFAPAAESNGDLTYVPIPENLPAPVARYFRTIAGDQLPLVRTAIVSGRARMRFGPITFPARFRFSYEAGQSYHHDIVLTLFGQPVLRADESYIDGSGRMVLPFGVIENEPKVDMAANLGLWGEAVWLPSILATDPRVRWEAIDATTARLIVPFGDAEDSIDVTFDPQTGLIAGAIAQRYREAQDTEKIGWRLQFDGWQRFNGLLIPSPAGVRWMDQASPWAVFNIEEVFYNVPLSPPL